ncbi:Smr/MutS family protein [Palleronia sp. KMU-117]|uniref:Smr/MutS family protein n=1 Tax=Palleronia sp. KMU-117 TaxID=3434108 RepID=UPI003D74DBFC
MSRRKPRTLDARERALWAEVVKSAAPLRKEAPGPLHEHAPAIPEPTPEFTPPPATQTGQQGAPATIPSFRIGERALSAFVPPGREPHLRMDKRVHDRLKRGKFQPEARIDLHGMTVADAHGALTAFILRAHADGRRLVLVITGKGQGGDRGGPIPEARGVLRRQVPHWLGLPPLAPIILQVVDAHQKHGGSGAFYVYLRRR